MQAKQILVNELQLGSRLNQAVKNNTRGDFGLLLSMLSQDARDWPQFHLQDTLTTDDKLRQQLQLPESQPLRGDLSQQHVIDNARHFLQEGADSFRLAQALTPEPLVVGGAYPQQTTQVLENCSLLTRQRFAGQVPQLLPETPSLAELVLQQRLAQDTPQAA
ncbi:VC2046/SO_2500 family protein [Shewanella sp. YIC-542]|uniref:VC2046/SO_2500 family protein n=1 Tax=Shewanella mytili TaxID=3377111 RepID=UPI00398E8A11